MAVSKAPKKRGVQTYSEANSTASASSSSFTHTVQLVSQHKEDEELAHIKEHVASIKDAISTLENLNAAGYAEELRDLKKELALAVIHQVKMMKQRAEQYKHHRATDAAGDIFAHQLVSSASNSMLLWTIYASLRHAVCSHFNKVVANHSKIQEFNTVFYAHFAGGKIADCFWDLVNAAMEEEPEDSDAWILKNFPSKSEYQKVDKLKVHFGHSVIDCATKARHYEHCEQLESIVESCPSFWKEYFGHASSDQVTALSCKSSSEWYSEHAQTRWISHWKLG